MLTVTSLWAVVLFSPLLVLNRWFDWPPASLLTWSCLVFLVGLFVTELVKGFAPVLEWLETVGSRVVPGYFCLVPGLLALQAWQLWHDTRPGSQPAAVLSLLLAAALGFFMIRGLRSLWRARGRR